MPIISTKQQGYPNDPTDCDVRDVCFIWRTASSWVVPWLYLGYRGIKKVTAPKMLEYKAMPQLGYIPEKSLPVEVKTALDQINDKGEKLRVIYGDTNNDGKIDDKDTVNETYVNPSSG